MSYFPCIYKYQSNVQQDTFPKQTKNGAKIIDEFYIHIVINIYRQTGNCA